MAISAAEKLILTVGLLNFAGLFVYLGVFYYFVFTKMDFMVSHLKNCPLVMNRINSLRSGLPGKMYVFGAITAVLTVPGRMIRIGGASAEDIENFPADLKRKIVVLHWSGMTALLIMCVLWLIIELELV